MGEPSFLRPEWLNDRLSRPWSSATLAPLLATLLLTSSQDQIQAYLTDAEDGGRDLSPAVASRAILALLAVPPPVTEDAIDRLALHFMRRATQDVSQADAAALRPQPMSLSLGLDIDFSPGGEVTAGSSDVKSGVGGDHTLGLVDDAPTWPHLAADLVHSLLPFKRAVSISKQTQLSGGVSGVSNTLVTAIRGVVRDAALRPSLTLRTTPLGFRYLKWKQPLLPPAPSTATSVATPGVSAPSCLYAHAVGEHAILSDAGRSRMDTRTALCTRVNEAVAALIHCGAGSSVVSGDAAAQARVSGDSYDRVVDDLTAHLFGMTTGARGGGASTGNAMAGMRGGVRSGVNPQMPLFASGRSYKRQREAPQAVDLDTYRGAKRVAVAGPEASAPEGMQQVLPLPPPSATDAGTHTGAGTGTGTSALGGGSGVGAVEVTTSTSTGTTTTATSGIMMASGNDGAIEAPTPHVPAAATPA